MGRVKTNEERQRKIMAKKQLRREQIKLLRGVKAPPVEPKTEETK